MKPHLYTIVATNGATVHIANETNPVYSAFSAISAVDKESSASTLVQIMNHLTEHTRCQMLDTEDLAWFKFASKSVIDLQRGMLLIEYDYDSYIAIRQPCPSDFQIPITDIERVYKDALLESAETISENISDGLVQLFDQEPDLDSNEMQIPEM